MVHQHHHDHQGARALLALVKSLTLLVVILALFVSLQQQNHRWLLLFARRTPAKPTLRFDERGRFKIVQLTDLHLGEDPFTDWAPRADRKTFALIRRILHWEQPDLVVLSGDMLTANNIDRNATTYLHLLAAVVEEYSVPYAILFGNHDDMDLEIKNPNGTTSFIPAKTSRSELARFDQRHHRYSLTEEGPADVFGVSNYILFVWDDQHSSNSSSHVKLQIALLDSGGGSLEQQIVKSQMEWYRSQRLPNVDAVAFQHIPTQEFRFQSQNTTCRGFHEEGYNVSFIHNDSVAELNSLLTTDPRLHFLAVGHDHGNSYCCPAFFSASNATSREDIIRSASTTLHVCFGRHSGYGGYGETNWIKGARVYEMTLSQGNAVQWQSWVRLETGFIVDHYSPPGQ